MPKKRKATLSSRRSASADLRPRGQSQFIRNLYVILAFVIVLSLILSLVLVTATGGPSGTPTPPPP